MTFVNAMDTLNKEIPEVLTKAGLINGVTNKNANKTKFYRGKAPELKDTQASTYVVWRIISADPINRADDKVRNRDAFVLVAIYTRDAFNSKTIRDMIEAIQNASIAKGYEFEFSSQDEDKDLMVNYISFDLSKTL